MVRLYRPPIPTSLKVEVAERQLKESGRADLLQNYGAVRCGETLTTKLALLRSYLAEIFGCDQADLRLDHDPPLGARPKERRGLGKKTYYIPDANDPEHLFYRPHGPEHAGSHLIKTNVRGDHGQHPDRVLIKKQRRIERGPKPKRGPKLKGRGFEKKTFVYSNPKMKAQIAPGKMPKPNWPKRPFGSGGKSQ